MGYSEQFTVFAGTLDYWRLMPHTAAISFHPDRSMKVTDFSQYIDARSVENIAKAVASVAILGEEDVADTVLSFVQNFGYTMNDYTILYTLYPVETLAQSGVCDDLSVLYASMMISLGFKVIFIICPQVTDLGGSRFTHMNVGVHLSVPPTHMTGTQYHYFELDGLDYYVAETTSMGWQNGDLPQNLAGQSDYLERAYAPTRSIYPPPLVGSSPSFEKSSYITRPTIAVESPPLIIQVMNRVNFSVDKSL